MPREDNDASLEAGRLELETVDYLNQARLDFALRVDLALRDRARRCAPDRGGDRVCALTAPPPSIAEEATQEAFESALEKWRTDGVPAHPRAWLAQSARNAAIDRLRHRKLAAGKLETYAADLDEAAPDAPGPNEISDDRLRLVFTCCHPSLALEAQVAQTNSELAQIKAAIKSADKNNTGGQKAAADSTKRGKGKLRHLGDFDEDGGREHFADERTKTAGVSYRQSTNKVAP